MNACIGKDLTGEIAKSQALLLFKSSYEVTASVPAVAVDIAVFAGEFDEDEDLLVPDGFTYNNIHSVSRKNDNPLRAHAVLIARPIAHALEPNLPLTHRQNLAVVEACSCTYPRTNQKKKTPRKKRVRNGERAGYPTHFGFDGSRDA
jgi:hypothetical protein